MVKEINQDNFQKKISLISLEEEIEDACQVLKKRMDSLFHQMQFRRMVEKDSHQNIKTQ
jgi:hypothetical protein